SESAGKSLPKDLSAIAYSNRSKEERLSKPKNPDMFKDAPHTVIIGGGVVDAGEWFLGPARIEGERRAWAESWAQCEVVPAALGPMAGAIGAALLSLE
ncbi:MAG: hypothetical protein VX385_02350, partial [Acidobacteriota bacterium]|nr:hypothetical protein [Acidobacteriota bacterium]